MALTAKQKKFCLEYAKSENAKQAAIKAGYSKKTAKSIGNENLTKPDLQSELQRLSKKTKKAAKKETKKAIADAAEIQSILSAILRGELTEETIVVEDTDDGMAKAATKEKKPSFKDRISAADKLARMQGAYNDRMQISGALPVVIVDDIKGQ